MMIPGFGRSLVRVGALLTLAACGGSQPPIGMPGATSQAPAIAPARAIAHNIRTASSSYQLVYSFGRLLGDGTNPWADLLNVKGRLYGTTVGGGAGSGTVFSVTPSGKEKVIHSFDGPGDGGYPYGTFINVNGTLYSTTAGGGTMGYGTVFSVTPSGTETVLHSFGGSQDGSDPYAGLLNVNGTLYGVTSMGGGAYCSSRGCGTVYSITTSGNETVLYSFKGGSGDGVLPTAVLVDVKGTLYGTTSRGGVNGDGTVFSVTTSGTEETVLHSFGGSGDGETPAAGLLNVNGTLYGTTSSGGANCSSRGCGTVYSITRHGKETVLYRFKGGSGDGEYPNAVLINVNGTLYGTTTGGGVNGDGTVFSVTTSGTEETVLHSFGGSGDGEVPYAGLLNVNGTLYGTTYEGGANGDGTVYSITP